VKFQLKIPSDYLDKTAELSQRRPRDAPNIWDGCTEKFRESSLCTQLLFQKFIMDFCSDRYWECAYKIWST